jgi:hypothetical protein
VAVEAGDAQARLGDLAVLRLIELLLRERGEQQPQAFHLNRRDDAGHGLIEIPDGEQLSAGDVAELGVRPST